MERLFISFACPKAPRHKSHKLRSKETAESAKNELKKKTPHWRSHPPKSAIFRVCANSLHSNSALHLSEKPQSLEARHQGRGGSKHLYSDVLFLSKNVGMLKLTPMPDAVLPESVEGQGGTPRGGALQLDQLRLLCGNWFLEMWQCKTRPPWDPTPVGPRGLTKVTKHPLWAEVFWSKQLAFMLQPVMARFRTT